MKLKFINTMVQEGDKGGEGGGGAGNTGATGDKGGEGDKGDKGALSDKQFEKIAESMSALASGMQSIQESQTKADARIDAISKAKDKDDKDTQDKNSALSDTDLENLSRTEFANSIIDRVIKEVSKQFEQVNDSVKEIRKDAGNASIETEIEKLEGQHKDFWDWKGEIKALATENPNTNIGRLYHMARQENSKKAEELDKKYKSTDKGGDGPKEKSFGGLMPTSSVIEPSEKMDKKDAADKAFDDTMSNINFGGG